MIKQGVCHSFKTEILRGVHQDVDDYRIALFSPSATLTPDVERYTPEGEVFGQGYVAGGKKLLNTLIGLDGEVAFLGWSDPVWEVATVSAAGALVYNASKENRAVVVVDFHEVVSSTNARFALGPCQQLVRIG